MVLLSENRDHTKAETEYSSFHYLKETFSNEELIQYKKEVDLITRTPFILRYISEPTITDINFDGTKLYIEDKFLGLQKADVQPTFEEVTTFLTLVKNVKNAKFDFSNTRMNVVLGYLRINAVHSANNTEGHSFSIRVARPFKVVNSLEELFIDSPENIREDLAALLKVFVQAKIPIVLSGETGSGKTETQKLLIGTVAEVKDGEQPTHQIIVVEDTPDSHIKNLYPNSCIRSWTTDERFTASMAVIEGMRNNPDIFMIAEIRGEEAGAAFDAVKTNHGLVTTVHSLGAIDTPSRLMPLIRLSPQFQTMTDSLLGNEIAKFFPICIHLVKEQRIINGVKKTVRYPTQIAELTGFNVNTGFEGTYLYKRDYQYDIEKSEYTKVEEISTLSKTMIQRIANQQLIHNVPDIFIKKEVN